MADDQPSYLFSGASMGAVGCRYATLSDERGGTGPRHHCDG
ncbi:hypothetical protein ACSYGO_43340 [Streptomyces krungchingensis]